MILPLFCHRTWCGRIGTITAEIAALKQGWSRVMTTCFDSLGLKRYCNLAVTMAVALYIQWKAYIYMVLNVEISWDSLCFREAMLLLLYRGLWNFQELETKKSPHKILPQTFRNTPSLSLSTAEHQILVITTSSYRYVFSFVRSRVPL